MAIVNRKISLFDGYNRTITTSTSNTVTVPFSLSDLIPANASISHIQYDNDVLFQPTTSNGVVATSVISLSIDGINNGETLSSSISFVFELKFTSSSSIPPTCAYYNFMTLEWNTNGCQMNEALSNSTHIACECTHLTNFAVLLDFNGNTNGLSEFDRIALNYITNIGCSISIFFLGITFLVFLFFKA